MKKKLLMILALATLAPNLSAVTLDDVLEAGNYSKDEETLNVSAKGIDNLYYWEGIKKIRGISTINLGDNLLDDLPSDFIRYIVRKHIIVYLNDNYFESSDIRRLFGTNKGKKMWFIGMVK